jgi:predicted ATPase
MRRFVLTGTPGSGKTSIIRALEVAGHVVIEEAATDVIALEQTLGNTEPWTHPSVIDKITRLQKHRQLRASELPSTLQFFDRSPICTHSLCTFLGYSISATLREEIARIRDEQIYETRVFFIENLGFCEPTAARRIGFEESIRFERVHEEAYCSFGYKCIRIAPLALPERVAEIARHVAVPA